MVEGLVSQPIEALKYALRQTKDGVVVSFVIHPDDVTAELLADPIGARYQMVMVRIGDDEQPVVGREFKTKEPTTPLDEANRKLVASAGILCREPAFWDFLFKQKIWWQGNRPEREVDAVLALHKYLAIDSRAELVTNKAARAAFIKLREEYHREQDKGR